MDRKFGIFCAIIISLLAYLTNIFFNDLDINIGASTLALIMGAILANFTSNAEKGGKWMIKIIMPIAIILLGFGLELTSLLKSERATSAPPVSFSQGEFKFEHPMNGFAWKKQIRDTTPLPGIKVRQVNYQLIWNEGKNAYTYDADVYINPN